VTEAIRLRTARDLQETKVNKLESELLNQSLDYNEIVTLRQQITDEAAKLDELKKDARSAAARLGVTEQQELSQYLTDPYVTKRVQALNVKSRIREKVRFRKFEMERSERAFRKQHNGLSVMLFTLYMGLIML
jgi:Fe-S cluster assembly scaffold protein SufB